jgi:hypothetical protein
MGLIGRPNVANNGYIAHCVDVSAHGKECVDDVEVAFRSRMVEGGPSVLRWGGGEEVAAMGFGV